MSNPYTPTTTSFKAQFARGQFTYGTQLPDVLDTDITNAIAEAETVFNPDLYPTDNSVPGTLAELFLVAHFLQLDIDASDNGANPVVLQSSRSVGGVSEALDIPDWMKSQEFAFYTTTAYGQRYLIISKPYLGGAVFSVPGDTLP